MKRLRKVLLIDCTSLLGLEACFVVIPLCIMAIYELAQRSLAGAGLGRGDLPSHLMAAAIALAVIVLPLWRYIRSLHRLIAHVAQMDRKVGAERFYSGPRYGWAATLAEFLDQIVLADAAHQAELVNKTRYMEALVDNAAVAILVLDKEHRVTMWNTALEELTGMSADEVIGTDRAWRAFYADQRPILADLVLDCAANAETHYPAELHKLSSGALQAEGWVTRPDGAKRYVYFTAVPIRDASGGAVAVIETLNDITARKEAEEELKEANVDLEQSSALLKVLHGEVIEQKAQLEAQHQELEAAHEAQQKAYAQLLQQEKMASLGVLAAGVAHEINNPMAFIYGNLDALKKYTARELEYITLCEAAVSDEGRLASLIEDRKRLKIDRVFEDQPVLIAESLVGADRVKKIVLDLKSFAHLDRAEKSYFRLVDCLESSLTIAWNEIKYKAELVRQYQEVPPVHGFPQKLSQVFMNLLVNAAQAIKEQGLITVRIRSDDTSVYVSVCDTGSGIPPEHIPRLFVPFFTTKEPGKGTGLGLSISYDIVKKHDGDITVVSEPGVGTTFTVRLPIPKEALCKEAPKEVPK